MNQALLKLIEASKKDVGHSLVAPSFHANSNVLPEESRESAAFFRSGLLGHPYFDTHNPIDYPGGGGTEKVHFRVSGRTENGKPLPSSIFMVKPYYENLDEWAWGHYPISGWAEMMYQQMLHAGNLGHMAMRVHTFPYNGSSLLGIELDPGYAPVASTPTPELMGNAEPWNPEIEYGVVHFPHTIKQDAAKLAALDFLLNHQDRHAYNLLMRVGSNGTCHSLLAIDNGLSGQYLESNRFGEFRNRDHLFHYLNTPAIRTVLPDDWGQALPSISEWWKVAKPRLVTEFAKQVSGIQHPELANHMLKSFNDRAATLDTVTDDIDEHGSKPYEQYMDGKVDGQNKRIYHRASVKVRDWKPQHDPYPDPFGAEHPSAASSQCPTCGDNLSGGER